MSCFRRNLQVVDLILGPEDKLSKVAGILDRLEIEPERFRVLRSGNERHVLIYVRGPAALKQKILRQALEENLAFEEED